MSPDYHAWTHRSKSKGGTDPIAQALVVYCIKLWADWQRVRVKEGRFQFLIDEDVDGLSLTKVELYVTTVSSSGIVQVQIRNASVDMLSTRIQCDSGEKHSRTASTAYVIDTANDQVAHGDHISIDVDAAGTGAKGAGISLTFE